MGFAPKGGLGSVLGARFVLIFLRAWENIYPKMASQQKNFLTGSA
jgi:hypothetical protein